MEFYRVEDEDEDEDEMKMNNPNNHKHYTLGPIAVLHIENCKCSKIEISHMDKMKKIIVKSMYLPILTMPYPIVDCPNLTSIIFMESNYSECLRSITLEGIFDKYAGFLLLSLVIRYRSSSIAST